MSLPKSQFVGNADDTADLHFWGVHFDDALEALQLINRRTVDRRRAQAAAASGIEARSAGPQSGPAEGESPTPPGVMPDGALHARTTDGGDA